MVGTAGILGWAARAGAGACTLLSAAAWSAGPCPGGQWLGCSSPSLQGESVAPDHFAPALRYSLAHWRDESRFVRVHLGAQLDTRPALRRWRYGMGLDVALPWEGMLEASLYTSRRRGKRAPRFDLAGERWGKADGGRRWALGAYVAPMKQAGGRRELTVAPQLRADLDALRLLPGRAELTLDYVPWERCRPEHRDDRTWQLNLHWSF